MDWLRKNGSSLEGDKLYELSAAIDEATRGMSGLKPWSPPAAKCSNESDPVFEAIKNHKRAMRDLRAATKEQNRYFALADKEMGSDRISVLDMREPSTPPGWHPYVDVTCGVDIEKYLPKPVP